MLESEKDAFTHAEACAEGHGEVPFEGHSGTNLEGSSLFVVETEGYPDDRVGNGGG